MEKGRTVADAALVIRLAYFSHSLIGRSFTFVPATTFPRASSTNLQHRNVL
jgi:hypothetical protein